MPLKILRRWRHLPREIEGGTLAVVLDHEVQQIEVRAHFEMQ